MVSADALTGSKRLEGIGYTGHRLGTLSSRKEDRGQDCSGRYQARRGEADGP